MFSSGSASYEEIDAMIETRTIRYGKMFKCSECDYETTVKGNLGKHIEAKHISPGVTCEFCSKFCPTRHALRMHITRQHSVKYRSGL